MKNAPPGMLVRLSAMALGLSVALPASAVDPPDSKVNLVSGHIEISDSTWTSGNYEVRHVDNPGDGLLLKVTTLTWDFRDDVGARMTIAPAGDTWIVWWRDAVTDEVRFRKRSFGTQTWGGEFLISAPSENSRNPEITHFGTGAWVAYEFDHEGETGIAVRFVQDEPDPFATRILLGTSIGGKEADVRIHREGERLWVTWIHDDEDLAWSRYDVENGVWGPVGHESFPAEAAVAARTRVRVQITGEDP